MVLSSSIFFLSTGAGENGLLASACIGKIELNTGKENYFFIPLRHSFRMMNTSTFYIKFIFMIKK